MTTHRQLIQQAVHIPEDDTYLQSTHQHDYVAHQWTDAEGRKCYYAVDGGTAYCRRAGDLNLAPERVRDWCLYEDDPFERIAERFLWGTYGKPPKLPMRYRPVATFELDHLKAILSTQPQIRGKLSERVVQHWVKVKEGQS